MMNQLKLYKYATWGLLFLNIAVLTFFLLTKPHPRPHQSPDGFQSEVVEILNLNSQQAATFKELAQEHNQKMESINEQQKNLLPPYFESLSDLSINIDRDSILNDFQQLERKKIEVTFQHFQDLKSILDEEQLPYFDRLIGRLIDRLLLKNSSGPPPPKRR
ncbi:MAG: hypothetical protein R3B93_18060 [Bacteroidia bacterium]